MLIKIFMAKILRGEGKDVLPRSIYPLPSYDFTYIVHAIQNQISLPFGR